MSALLGTTNDGQDLVIDLDRLVGSHALAIANSGGGKSQLLRRILETTHGRIQQVVLDPEDELYTLRERFDYVIAGGDGADVPATVANAGDLARSALEFGYSLIVQLNDLGDDAPKFVGRFLSALMKAPRSADRPLLIAIDELQRFIPSGAATEASAPVKDLVQRGRKRGFTALGASLRITEIDPGFRGLVNNWMLGRVGQTLDRNTMADQLGFTRREGLDKLRALEPRFFWGFGPAIAPEPVLFRVADVETTAVRPGQAKVPTPPAPAALREILAGLARPAGALPDDTIPADPQAAFNKAGVVGSMLVERDRRIEELDARVAALSHDRETLDVLAARILEIGGRIQRDVGELLDLVDDERSLEGAPERTKVHHPDADSPPVRRRTANGAAPAEPKAPLQPAGGALPNEPGLNATAIAFAALLRGAYPDGFSWDDGLLLIGRRPGSGDAGKARAGLLQLGLMQVTDGQCHATEALLARADFGFGSWPAPGELIEQWAEKLRGPGGDILRDLAKHGASTKAEIGARIDKSPTSGWFGKGLKDLRRSNLVRLAGDRLQLHHYLQDDEQ